MHSISDRYSSMHYRCSFNYACHDDIPYHDNGCCFRVSVDFRYVDSDTVRFALDVSDSDASGTYTVIRKSPMFFVVISEENKVCIYCNGHPARPHLAGLISETFDISCTESSFLADVILDIVLPEQSRQSYSDEVPF